MPENLTPAQASQVSLSKKDEILPLFRIGQRVKLIKDIRNDGTFPFAKIGDTLMKAGEEGYVKDRGDFLQVIRVYEVEFIAHGVVYGCREEELEAADEGGYDEVADELEWLKRHREEKRLKSQS